MLHRACVSRIVIFVLALAFSVRSAGADSPPVKPRSGKAGADFFEKQIRPILVQHCYQCHSGDPKKAKGRFVLDTRDGLKKGGKSGSVITPGHPDESLFIEAVRYESLQMPPKGQLPDELIDKLVRWVEIGAPDPRVGKAIRIGNKIDFAQARKFWAFQRPRAVAPPSVHNSAWPVTDIDRVIRARQEAEQLEPVADADKVTLIRRVTFDLTGLPPTASDIDAFLKDESTNAFDTVVDRLLASPQFGERWARHWLDVVRYGESTGKDVNLPYRYAWRYRNYVIDALNADKPYNRFIFEQIAGDLLSPRDAAERDDLKIATGFLALGPKSIAQNEEQFRYEVIDDQIDVTTRAFLGLTVACARCHDHKYDPIPTSDYYALAGVFRSTQTMAGVNAGRRVAIETRLLRLAGPGQNKNAGDKEGKERREEIQRLEKQLNHLRQVLQKPPSKKGQQNRAGSKPPPNPKEIREEIKKLQERLDKLEMIPSTSQDLAMGVREGVPGNSPLLNRGELRDKGRPVPRGVLSVLKPPDFHIDPRHSGRLAVAYWIANKENPLTARVIVNRVWEHLFGQGLVTSVDNFGALGEEPTHPELLDTLAVRFVDDQNWSLKKLIRSIVLSRVYRLSSSHHAGNFAIDPSNKYLWRMERRRLDAEEIRDAMLLASGQLDLARPEGSPLLGLDNGQVRGGKPLQEVRKPTNHRSIYLPMLRGLTPEMLQVFDEADPSLIVGQRDVTTVAPQALFMMNNPFVLAQSALTARRVLTTGRPGPDARIDLAYQLALGRQASQHEKMLIKSYLVNYRKSVETAKAKVNPQFVAWASFCQTLFASGEFRYLY
jgi:hypothetical protein